MQRILIDLNRNLLKLNGKFKQLAYSFYSRQIRKIVDKSIDRVARLFGDVFEAVEEMKFDKAFQLALEFLDEADQMAEDLALRLAHKSFDKLIESIRELIHLIRGQVIFLDQYRQTKSIF